MNLYIASGLMLVGVAAHFVSKLSALEEAGTSPKPLDYLRTHPWRILNMLIACEILLLLFNELNQLNYVTALLTGYTCQSASENLRRRAENRMRAIPDPNEENPK